MIDSGRAEGAQALRGPGVGRSPVAGALERWTTGLLCADPDGMSLDVASHGSHRLLAWARTDELAGHSMARVERRPGGWRLHGAEVVGGPSAVFVCSFRMDVDDAWFTRAVTVRVVDEDGERELSMTVAVPGSWRVDGAGRPDLEGCLDVDVAATPLTNTFPIRRLATLQVHEEVSLPVAWVDIPSLSVSRVEQTYRRLPDVGGLAAWEYRDDAHGRFALQVDDDGLVVEYEGFARRTAATPWRRGSGTWLPSVP